MIDNIYEWLYDHYYTPHAEEILRSYQSLSPSVQDAEQLLIYGGGDHLDREDALNLCLDGAGISAFAAGMYVAYRLMADLDFLDN